MCAPSDGLAVFACDCLPFSLLGLLSSLCSAVAVGRVPFQAVAFVALWLIPYAGAYGRFRRFGRQFRYYPPRP